MATYSNNTTIKFLTTVTLNGNASYTVPANSYAIVSLRKVVGGPGSDFVPPSSGSLSIDGLVLASYSGATGPTGGYFETSTIYVPAGKVVSTSASGKVGVGYALLTVFTNTP